MAGPPSAIKTEVLARLRLIGMGRVVTHEVLAASVNAPPPLIATLLANLTDEEREMVPWHRVVAKGGAIGRGPNREQQFARLMHEGVLVSPAGVVQDLARVAQTTLEPPTVGRGTAAADAAAPPPSPVGQRSRGMKQRP